MPAPLRLIRDGAASPGAKPRAVVVPYQQDLAGYHSEGGKRSNALDLLKELQGTARTHGSLLHELRDIYKHLRVELKDDICDLVEQIKAAPRETKDKERALRPGLSGNLSPPRSHEPSPARSREPSGREDWSLPNQPDEWVAEDVEEEQLAATQDTEREGSGEDRRFAWGRGSLISNFSRRPELKRQNTISSLGSDEKVRPERMPAVPMNKTKYHSLVDHFSASLALDDDAGLIERMVTNDSFDYVMGLILALNAMVVGIQVDLVSREVSDPLWSRVIDLTFCLIFVIELVMRCRAYGSKFFSMDGWQWNFFDLVVVVFSVADETTKLVLSDSEVQEVFDSFGILRLLRLGRVVRLVRMVRLIPALKSMVYLILASLKSFLWTVVLLIILMYCVAVYFTELAFDLRNKHPEKDFGSVNRTWGSISNSIFSLFQAITGGNDWHVFISVFEDYVGTNTSTNTLVFSIFIAFATLVMMNLVTGVFVDGAQRIAREEKNQDLLKHVRRLIAPERHQRPRKSIFMDGEFSLDDGDRYIEWPDFCRKLDTDEMRAYLTAFELDAGRAKDIFYILDQDRVGKITMREFFSACVNLHGTPRLADTAILRHLIMRTFADLSVSIKKLEDQLTPGAPQMKPEKPRPSPSFGDDDLTLHQD